MTRRMPLDVKVDLVMMVVMTILWVNNPTTLTTLTLVAWFWITWWDMLEDDKEHALLTEGEK